MVSSAPSKPSSGRALKFWAPLVMSMEVTEGVRQDAMVNSKLSVEAGSAAQLVSEDTAQSPKSTEPVSAPVS